MELHWKFYKLMKKICEEYDDKWESQIHIREVDRFMGRIIQLYNEIENQ
jgi:hypothetical protein